MPSHSIAAITGDGIGPEVISQAIRVADAAVFASGEAVLNWTSFPWNATQAIETGRLMPTSGARELRSFDAVLFGPFGHNKLRDPSIISGFFQSVRKELDLAICLRRVFDFQGQVGAFHDSTSGKVDVVFVHTLQEGDFTEAGGFAHQHAENEVAIQTQMWTRKGLDRLFRFAFELAEKRRRVVFAIRPPESQRHAVSFWERALTEISTDYPSVSERSASFTHAGIEILARPDHCDVVVGGIAVASLADFLSYGLGTLPFGTRAEINPSRTSPSFFGPMHGPSLEKAGMGIADPLASILAAANLVEFLGLVRATEMIRDAVRKLLLNRKILSADLGGKATTQQIAEAIMRSFQ